MVQFTKIVIDNYKSIGHMEIFPMAGLYKVIGDNQDSTYISNGAAKSSTVQAIMLGLYNRDFSGVNLDMVSNRNTGKPWRIEIDFQHTIGTTTTSYKVINIKSPAKMMLYKEGDRVAYGSTQAVPYIEKLLGMGWQTFKLTHFITAQTITELTQNLSQPQLFNDILHLVELQDLDKRLQKAIKELSVEVDSVDKELAYLRRIEQLLSMQDRYNKEELEETLQALTAQLEQLESRFSLTVGSLKDKIDSFKVEVMSIEKEILSLKTSIRNGVCSACNSILVDKDSLRMMNDRIIELSDKLLQVKSLLESKEKEFRKLNSDYIDVKEEVTNSINQVSTDLSVAKELDSSSSKFELISKLKEIEQESNYKNTVLSTMSKMRTRVKNGDIVADALNRFFSFVQVKIDQYSELINLDQYYITVSNSKLGMEVIVRTADQYVPIELLSNGEKTRLSILLLISMLDAMKSISESETNYLVFDEASASFDSSGVDELSKLFNYLKHLGQSIFLITHGSELDQVPYDFEMKVTKIDGISSSIITRV